jgi:type VI secretion system secreted protein VgrG
MPGYRIRIPHGLATAVYTLTYVEFTVVEGSYLDKSAGEMVGEVLRQTIQSAGTIAMSQVGQQLSNVDVSNIKGFDPGFTGPGAIGVGILNTPWLKNLLANFFDTVKIPVLSGLWEILFGKKPPEIPYSNQFKCIPDGTPFRPPRVTDKPRIVGTQSAVVVGKEGENIYTDEYGRVKVQFFWDRAGKHDENSSCWIRVAQFWSGLDRGAQWIPRIGDEVLVNFLDGDPDRPIIIGSVDNSDNMPPFALTRYKTLSGIKTRSVPTNDAQGNPNRANRYHLLRFNDTRGKEQYLVRSQGRLDITAVQSRYETIGGDRHLTVGGEDGAKVWGDYYGKVYRHYHLHVGDPSFPMLSGNRITRIEQNDDIRVKKDSNQQIDGNWSTGAGGQVTIDANGKQGVIVLNATTNITLTVGESTIVMSPGQIVIQSAMVLINPGLCPDQRPPIDPRVADPTAPKPADSGDTLPPFEDPGDPPTD